MILSFHVLFVRLSLKSSKLTRFHGTRWRVPFHNSLPSLGLNRVWRYAHSNCMFNWNSVWSHQQSHNKCCLMCMWFYVQLKWKTWSMQTWTDTKTTTVLISSFFWKFTFFLIVLFQRSIFFLLFWGKKNLNIMCFFEWNEFTIFCFWGAAIHCSWSRILKEF